MSCWLALALGMCCIPYLGMCAFLNPCLGHLFLLLTVYQVLPVSFSAYCFLKWFHDVKPSR